MLCWRRMFVQCLLFVRSLMERATCPQRDTMLHKETLVARWSACVLQGIASAPLWDADTATVPGMVSASDFIQVRHLPCVNVVLACTLVHAPLPLFQVLATRHLKTPAQTLAPACQPG